MGKMCNVAIFSYFFLLNIYFISFDCRLQQLLDSILLLFYYLFICTLFPLYYLIPNFANTNTFQHTLSRRRPCGFAFFIRDNDIRINFYNYFKYYILLYLLLHCEPQRPARFNIEDFLTYFLLYFLLKNNPRKKKETQKRQRQYKYGFASIYQLYTQYTSKKLTTLLSFDYTLCKKSFSI